MRLRTTVRLFFILPLVPALVASNPGWSASSPKTKPPPAKVAAAPAAAPPSVSEIRPWMVGAEKGLKPDLLVGLFSTASEDDLPWAEVFRQMLLYKIADAPNQVLYMPPRSVYMAEYRHLHRLPAVAPPPLSFSVDDTIRIARVLGIRRAMTGRFSKQGKVLTLIAQIYDVPTSRPAGRFEVSHQIENVADMLLACAKNVLERSLSVKLDPETQQYLARKVPMTGDMFQRVVDLWADISLEHNKRHAEWMKLYKEDPRLDLAKFEAIAEMAALAPERAVSLCRLMYASEPFNARVKGFFIALLNETGRYDEAIQQALTALTNSPNDLTILALLQKAYANSRQYENSIGVARRIVELKPNSFLSHQILGSAHEDYGRIFQTGSAQDGDRSGTFSFLMRQAYDAYRTASTINPNNPDVLAGMARTAMYLGASRAEIEKLCERALAIESDNLAAYNVLLDLCRLGGSGQAGRALELCQRAAKTNPESAPMQFLAAEYLMSLADSTATAILEQSIAAAIALDPLNPAFRQKAARYYHQRGNYAAAWEHQRWILDYVPPELRHLKREADHWAWVAWLAVNAKEWDAALDTAAKGLAENPTPVIREILLVCKGRAHYEKKQISEAMDTYTQLMEVGIEQKGFACGEYARLVLEHRPDLLDKGFEAARLAVVISPQEPNFHYTLALYYYHRGDLRNANLAVDTALSLTPNFPAARSLKAAIQKGVK